MTQMQPLPEKLSSISSACRTLADPTRLAILDLLTQGVQCNCVFGDRLGLPMNLISHHLKVLRRAGLVSIARNPEDARWIYYSLIAKKIAELRELIDSFLGREIVEGDAACGPTSVRVKRAILVTGLKTSKRVGVGDRRPARELGRS